MRKRVLITGGNKGIGLETTRLFVEADYEVIVIARDFSNFAYSTHPNVSTIQYDLTDVSGIKALAHQIGPIDILVNNAGLMNSLPYNDYPEEKCTALMNLNLYAPIELIKCFSEGMIQKQSGRIINTTSVAGQIGHPDIWYGVSKAGLINATKSFAVLLGPKGIVVNAIAPGPVETDMLHVIPEARKEKIKSTVFTDRFAKAEEVAKTIYWLATESPEYINGTCIDINNGAFLR